MTVSANNNTTIEVLEVPTPFYYNAFDVGAYAVFCTLIIMTSILTLVVLILNENLHTNAHVYITSLVIADVIMAVTLIEKLLPLIPYPGWTVGDDKACCIAIKCLFFVSATGSVSCLVLMSLDRYTCLRHPFWYNRNIRTRYVLLAIVVSWFVSIVTGISPLYINRVNKEAMCFIVMEVDYNYFIFFATYLSIAGVIIAVLFARIFSVASSYWRGGEIVTPTTLLEALPMLNFLMSSCVMSFVCWLPLLIVFGLRFSTSVSNIAITSSVNLATFNSAGTFLTLMTTSRDFRTSVKRTFIRCFTKPCAARDDSIDGEGATSNEERSSPSDSNTSSENPQDNNNNIIQQNMPDLLDFYWNSVTESLRFSSGTAV